MLIGKTGAGKSELINYLIGDKAAPTGCGEPVTMAFDEYECSFRNQFKIRIFDSKGLEVDGYNEISDEIVKFVNKRNSSESIQNWIHMIFYCVNIGRTRLEPYEEKFIIRIQEAAGYTIPIILTHCMGASNASYEESLKKRVQERLGEKTRVYFVNSKSERLKTGESYQQFGKEAVINDLSDDLWDNSACIFSRNYAHQMRTGLVKCIKEGEKEHFDLVDSSKYSDLIKGVYNEDSKHIDNTMAYINSMNTRYNERIKEFIDLHGSFSNAFGHMESSLSSPFGLTVRVFIDDDLDDEIMQLYDNWVKEIKNKKLIQAIIDRISYRWKIRDELKGYWHEITQLYLKRVPSEKEIADEVYSEFQKAKKENMFKSPVVRKYKKISANDLCPCGSGKKFKHCCRGKGIYD